MSQSPDEAAESADAERLQTYRDSWSALSQLIGQGRSFSGHERNCAFLNNATGRFVNISAASGLDLDDDGRAVALSDWDFDGDIDLWLANRTAPRVRLLRNDVDNGHHWIALRLRGTTSNRDAIGARVEVMLSNGTRMIKTVRAGDGYLSQSSKWLHFGLGPSKSLTQVNVRWPGGGRQVLENVTPDEHWHIVEGEGQPRVWTPPDAERRFVAATIQLPEVGSASRTWIVGRVPLPATEFVDDSGNTVSIDSLRGRPVWINLWSQTCVSCLQELSEWTEQQAEVRAVGLQVLALCVDQNSAADATRRILAKFAFPFSTGFATGDTVHTLELAQRTYLELQQPLPVPCSFLLDRHGALAAIYKGPVDVATVLRDMARLYESPKDQRDAAVPFAGRWASQVFSADPRPLMNSLEIAEDAVAATDYLQRYIAYAEAVPLASQDLSVAQAYAMLGDRYLAAGDSERAVEAYGLLLRLAAGDGTLQSHVAQRLLVQGLPRESLAHFRLALQADPQDANTLTNAGLAKMALREAEGAVRFFQASLRRRPNDADTHFHLANALHSAGRTESAIDHFRRSQRLRPNSPYAANNLAWILATHPDPKIRNGQEAVELAQASCERLQFRDPVTMATFAAALAETARFDEAVEMNRRAIELAKSSGNGKMVERLVNRQRLFESRRAFRDDGNS